MTALSTAAIAPLVIVGIFLEPYIVSRLRRVPGSSGEPLDEIKYGRSSRRTSSAQREMIRVLGLDRFKRIHPV
jgi:hypothetical protein